MPNNQRLELRELTGTNFMTAPETSRRSVRAGWSDGSLQIGGARNKLPDPTGKAGQIVAVMEQRLTLGYYAPGEMLSFNKLAEEFDISRQPVSVAILHLRASGYVEVIPQVGCRVVDPSSREIEDFFFVSSKIESAVVALAAERYENDEARVLLSIDPPKDLSSLSSQNQRRDYVSYIDRYHNQIWLMAHASLLEGQISGIRRLSNFYLWQGIPTLAPNAAKQLIRERSAIAKAIAARDGKSAAALMEQHIRNKPRLTGIVHD
jgi:DNA-binding GntR family transcriptional regulator